MNTGAEDDSRSTPTFAFCAVCAPAGCSDIAMSANAARLRAAFGNIVMSFSLKSGCVVAHYPSPVIPGRACFTREPRIHKHEPGLWIPHPAPKAAHPGMAGVSYTPSGTD